MSTAASAVPAFLRSFDLPEPGELRRVARVYVWGRWFVLSIATFAWLYPLNFDEVVHAPNAALAMLLFATNGYLHYRLATERTVVLAVATGAERPGRQCIATGKPTAVTVASWAGRAFAPTKAHRPGLISKTF